MKQFVSAILAGVMIGVGGMAYLAVGSVAGSLLFGVGLLSVLVFGLHLYTGKVGYLLGQKPSFLLDLVVIWFGNLAGAALTAVAFRLSRIGENQTIMQTVQKISDTKLADTPISMLILGFFCGLLIYIAVETFKKSENPVVQLVAVFVPVSVFIVSGFEHVVADMFYFTMAGSWSVKAIIYCIIITIGNSIGSLIIPLMKKIPEDK